MLLFQPHQAQLYISTLAELSCRVVAKTLPCDQLKYVIKNVTLPTNSTHELYSHLPIDRVLAFELDAQDDTFYQFWELLFTRVKKKSGPFKAAIAKKETLLNYLEDDKISHLSSSSIDLGKKVLLNKLFAEAKYKTKPSKIECTFILHDALMENKPLMPLRKWLEMLSCRTSAVTVQASDIQFFIQNKDLVLMLCKSCSDLNFSIPSENRVVSQTTCYNLYYTILEWFVFNGKIQHFSFQFSKSACYFPFPLDIGDNQSLKSVQLFNLATSVPDLLGVFLKLCSGEHNPRYSVFYDSQDSHACIDNLTSIEKYDNVSYSCDTEQLDIWDAALSTDAHQINDYFDRETSDEVSLKRHNADVSFHPDEPRSKLNCLESAFDLDSSFQPSGYDDKYFIPKTPASSSFKNLAELTLEVGILGSFLKVDSVGSAFTNLHFLRKIVLWRNYVNMIFSRPIKYGNIVENRILTWLTTLASNSSCKLETIHFINLEFEFHIGKCNTVDNMSYNWVNKYFKLISALQKLITSRQYPLDTVLFRDCSFLALNDIDCKCECDLPLQQLAKTVIIDDSCMFRDVQACQMFHYYFISLFSPSNYHILVIEVQQQEPFPQTEAGIHTCVDVLIKGFASNPFIESEQTPNASNCYDTLKCLTICFPNDKRQNDDKLKTVEVQDKKLSRLCSKLTKLSLLRILHDVKNNLDACMFHQLQTMFELNNCHLDLVPIRDINFTSDSLHFSNSMDDYRSQT